MCALSPTSPCFVVLLLLLFFFFPYPLYL
jgi:hypothetical protein